MSERPTHELKIEGGPLLVLQDYITGAENWKIRDIYASALEEKRDAASVALQAERKAFELVVTSIDRSSADIADRILAQPLHIYREITQAITEIIEGKKKSGTS